MRYAPNLCKMQLHKTTHTKTTNDGTKMKRKSSPVFGVYYLNGNVIVVLFQSTAHNNTQYHKPK